MHKSFKGWAVVAEHLKAFAVEQQAIEANPGTTGSRLNAGQQASLVALADRLPNNGVVIADEVGMGKTRIAVEAARAVIEAGGRVAVLVPPGLGYQWRDELRDGKVDSPPIIRSLGNYFDAWTPEDARTHVSKSSLPGQRQPWFSLPVVLVSHAFTNWKLGEKAASWRWSLLPEFYAHWRKRNTNRWPRDYVNHDVLLYSDVTAAAKSICEAIPDDPANVAWQKCNALSEGTPWPTALHAEQYARSRDLRPWLECAVGLGLGVFDLVIVDEAHKSRGVESGLSGLLDSVIHRSPSARVIAMTATPVELDVGQWQNTLARIGVDINSPPTIKPTIDAYAKAVRDVRLSPSNKKARETYKEMATAFQSALSRYLLRRDKRGDKAVIAFVRHSGLPANNYRQEEEITVQTASLAPAWRKAVCAAEALSFVSRRGIDGQSQRIRLTLGNGHGIAALLNRKAGDDLPDAPQNAFDIELVAEAFDGLKKSGVPVADAEPVDKTTSDKRAQRVEWWQKAMAEAFTDGDDCLFEHPALLACVKAIEADTIGGGKVLVFGRFTQPLRALVNLLNAREMVRCLQTKRPWPQGKIHDAGVQSGDQGDESPAVRAALRQLGSVQSLTEINEALARQYKELENLRERWRTGLVGNLEAGLGMVGVSAESGGLSKVQQLFAAFRESATASSDGSADGKDGQRALSLVGKALLELMGDVQQATPADFADAFEQLINALTDRDEGDQDSDGVMNKSEASELWPTLEARLKDEYDRPQGGFARLMYGGTAPSARRMLQLAFNRPQSFPKVLVAQSIVGREGLNLHKACSTVILLHPEWNPGIVEQQIGRVDRVGSHWSSQLDLAIANSVLPDQVPRIKVRPVIFKGTYDEYHWQVLRERWDDLRAQLHGVVIPPRLYANDPELQRLAEELEAVAPNFSPTVRSTSPLIPACARAYWPYELHVIKPDERYVGAALDPS